MKIEKYIAYTALTLVLATKPIQAEMTPQTTASGRVYDIPRVAVKTPDAADWGEGVGFRVDALTDPAVGVTRPAATGVDPSIGVARSGAAAADRFRLGWNEEGLLVYVDVRDTTPRDDIGGIWHGDCVHILVGRPGKQRDRLYYLIGPGRTSEDGKPNIHYRRYLPEKMIGDEPPEPHRYAVRKTEDGYIVEVLVPLKNLDLTPTEGVELEMQVMIFDRGFDGTRRTPRWAPARVGPEPEVLQHVRLAEKASSPVLAAAGCELGSAFPGALAAGVRVVADASLAGKTATVQVDESKTQKIDTQLPITEFRFGEAKDDWCEGFAIVPLPPASEAQTMEAAIILPDGAGVVPVPLGHAFAERREQFGKLEVDFKPWVFAGERFPQCGFKEAALADALSGFDYKIETRFFDADCKPVEKPERAGRYGAVVDVTAFGETKRKFFTLYRVPDEKALDFGHWYLNMDMRARFEGLPEGLGVDKRVWATDPAGIIGGDFKFFLRNQLEKEGQLATLLAALSELPEDVVAGHVLPNPRQRPYTRHREYIFNLRRAVGENPDYPFLTWTPKDYDKDASRRWPLVVYLHGSGDRGADLSVLKHNGPSNQEWLREDLPFILVSPLCPKDEWWDPTAVVALVDKICETMRVDTEKIYLTGVSMGGFGTCDVAAHYPERFAAIAPVCGFGNAGDTVWYKDVPIWTFHGAKDDIVPPDVTRKGVERLKELGSKNVHYTEYPEGNHGITDEAYGDRAFWTWLLEQRRKSDK